MGKTPQLNLDRFDALAAAGAVLTCCGLALLSVPLAVVVAGVQLVAVGLLGARRAPGAGGATAGRPADPDLTARIEVEKAVHGIQRKAG